MTSLMQDGHWKQNTIVDMASLLLETMPPTPSFDATDTNDVGSPNDKAASLSWQTQMLTKRLCIP
jgi:hypothetical protein